MVTNNIAIPTEKFWLCPLYSLNCHSESIDLTKGIQIKRAPDELREHISERTYHLYGLWSDPSDLNWAAFLPYYEGSTSSGTIAHRLGIAMEEQDKAGNLLIDLITALKLCHKGRVVAGPLISASKRNSEWSVGGGKVWTYVSKRDFLHEGPVYMINQSDVPEINELLNRIGVLHERGKLDNLSIALRRFHSSYHGDIEDRIIDQMIAFESLYLGDIQELKYKLALRVAFLLGKRRNQKEIIFNNMKKAYKYRSKLVHGDTQVSRNELRGIIHKTEDYLRKSIVKFLLLVYEGNSLKKIREELLDNNIFKNGKLLDIIG